MTAAPYIRRLLEPTVAARLQMMPVVVLTGARQTGKTTLTLNLLPAGRREYLTLDSTSVLERATREPAALLADRETDWTIDEVQRAPSLLLEIKRAVDENRRPGRFLITGSANLALLAQVGESLAGRVSQLCLYPLTEREKRADATPPVWPALLAAQDGGSALRAARQLALRPFDWRTAVLTGGFPPAVLAPTGPHRQVWFEGYVETYVQRDVRALSQVGDLGGFLRLVRVCFQRVGGELNQTDLAAATELPRSTVQRWLSVLEASFLITLVPPFHESREKRVIKRPRLYAVDTGLAAFLAAIDDEDELLRRPRHGGWLENLVLVDLLAWREIEARKPAICWRRTTSLGEVDFVVEAGRRLLPIEVKTAREPRIDDARALDAFCDEFPERAPFGLLVYCGDEAVQLTRRSVALPLSSLL